MEEALHKRELDLRAAIEANPRARKTFLTLGRRNLFSLVFRTNNMKTPAGRAKKIAALVAMLARGETVELHLCGVGSCAGTVRGSPTSSSRASSADRADLRPWFPF